MDKQIKKEVSTGIGMIIGGMIFLIAVLLGFVGVFDIETKKLILGTFIGCLFMFIGVGLVIIFKKLERNSTEYMKMVQNNDERNQLINYMAGNFSHKVTIWLIFSLLMAQFIIDINLDTVTALNIVLIASGITYFASLAYYNKNQ